MKEAISGVILAGGQGRRMGGADKGLLELRGRPLVAWVAEHLAPQVDELLINANRNLESYHPLGRRIVTDRYPDFAGPLAGLHAALGQASHALVATAPCDSPFLPEDLVARLRAALESSGAELAVAKTAGQPHPVFSLVRREVLDGLTAFLDAGGRKVDAWYAALSAVEVPFADERAFANINTLDELNEMEP